MRIEQVEPAGRDMFAGWHTALCAASSADREDPPLYTLEELAVTFAPGRSSSRREAYAAVADGEVIGAAQLDAPLRDNRTQVDVDVAVVPRHRRRGVGTALLTRLKKRSAELGRTSFDAEVHQPLDGPETPGAAFASRHGFSLGLTEVRRLLELPVEPERLRSLGEHAASRAAGYRIESWLGACPEEYAEQYAYLKSLLMTEAPLGDLRYEQEVWDIDRLREDEGEAESQGRTTLTAPSGELAGHTQIGLPTHDPGLSFQWDTLVLPAHRGHRLGLALKVANLLQLAREAPSTRVVNTWNAAENPPMVAVNDALGFRPVERL